MVLRWGRHKIVTDGHHSLSPPERITFPASLTCSGSSSRTCRKWRRSGPPWSVVVAEDLRHLLEMRRGIDAPLAIHQPPGCPPWSTVAIIGAGVQGLATALLLARAAGRWRSSSAGSLARGVRRQRGIARDPEQALAAGPACARGAVRMWRSFRGGDAGLPAPVWPSAGLRQRLHDGLRARRLHPRPLLGRLLSELILHARDRPGCVVTPRDRRGRMKRASSAISI